jgi:hypothetical protein
MRDLSDGFNLDCRGHISFENVYPSELDETARRVLRGRTGLTVRYVESMPELMAHAVALRQFSMWVVSSPAQSAYGLSQRFSMNPFVQSTKRIACIAPA